MRLFLCLALGLASAAWAADPASISKTKSLTFDGKQFVLGFHPEKSAVALYEYYPEGETPQSWRELVDFRIYPGADAPLDFARRLAESHQKKYPGANVGLYEDKEAHAVLLDFLYPTSTHSEPGKSFLELDAFKFFTDPRTGKTIGFHYARNIEGPGSGRQIAEVAAEIKSARTEILRAMAQVPVFSE